jgi:hypothetical protein
VSELGYQVIKLEQKPLWATLPVVMDAPTRHVKQASACNGRCTGRLEPRASFPVQ